MWIIILKYYILFFLYISGTEIASGITQILPNVCNNCICYSSPYLQLFQGNIDNNSHKKNLFEPPFYARFVRVLPWEWHERIALRMELLGCDD